MGITGVSQDQLLELARHAMVAHLGRKPINHELTQSMNDLDMAGIFVTVRDREDTSVMGSVGRLGPSNDPLGQVLAETAIAAIANDYRLETVTKAGLEKVQIEIAVLFDRKDVTDVNGLQPDTLGLVVETGAKRAVLLPNDAEALTPALQLSKAKKKAGIADDESIKMATFQVTRFQD